MPDPIEPLVEYCVGTKYKGLPEDIIEFTKLCVLDLIGVLIAGFDAPGCGIAVEFVKEFGGKPESSILRYGAKAPCPGASFANSIMARALDFDAGMRPGVHLNASTIPTAFAVGELMGSSGRDVLAAIAVGEDLAVRINQTTNLGITYGGFDPTGICGVFATTVVAGKLFELTEHELRNALGIAFNRAGGSFQNNIDGALMVRFLQGFVSATGVISALLARKGVSGPLNLFDGIYGYYKLFSHGVYDKSFLLNKLGKEFLTPRYTMFKRWPSCGATLSVIDGTLKLKEEEQIEPENIDEIIVVVGPYAYNLTGQPFTTSENPVVKAQFSLQYAVANVILRGRPTLKHYRMEYISDPLVQRMMNKIHVVKDESIETEFKAELIVKMRGGEIKKIECGVPKGHPANPITKDDILRKFYECVKSSSKPLPDEVVKEVIDKILNMEKLSNIEYLIELLRC
ncbi:MAG: MmgE/PrpD family protein [Candidatus Bathyarchaeia archaeon]